MPKTLVFGTPEGGEPCLLNVGLVSPSDLPSLARNVGFRGKSGSRFRAAEGPFVAITGLSGHVPMSLPDLFCGTEISVGNVQVGPANATRFAQLDLALKR